MVDVPSARKFGVRLELHETALAELMNGPAVTQFVSQVAGATESAIETHVRATASPADADNYVASLFNEDSFSDDYGFDFGGPYGLGNRPIAVIGVPSGRGVNPSAKPPLMVEAQTHALTSPPGVAVDATGEDIR